MTCRRHCTHNDCDPAAMISMATLLPPASLAVVLVMSVIFQRYRKDPSDLARREGQDVGIVIIH